ncbi:hypothetical protein TSOC_001042 [Tetrabaena socialis]|uniref:Uncharacterized protein n=1 Tax=Tetrabaena socialis TaxID=47790 RepID=A0A2J8AHU9_9CHLO|nr:hypothetical protein TSOC_001042 [Tetrabaena socialis]|eukprot:PNH12094.1 hypothetical protein TSOC_001042 [Tetrabaena socialis]
MYGMRRLRCSKFLGWPAIGQLAAEHAPAPPAAQQRRPTQATPAALAARLFMLAVVPQMKSSAHVPKSSTRQ